MKITWNDLTVKDAEGIRDFYSKLLGWDNIPIDMGGYDDYVMIPKDDPDTAASGICHARGSNAKLPPVWIPYVEVEDLDTSLSICEQGGGSKIDGPRNAGDSIMAIIQDPAGAYMGLVEKK